MHHAKISSHLVNLKRSELTVMCSILPSFLFFVTFASGTDTFVSHMSHGWLFWMLAVLCALLIFRVSDIGTTSSLFWWLIKQFINSHRLEIPHFPDANLWLWARQKTVCLIQGSRDFPCGHGDDAKACVIKTDAQSDCSWWSPPTADPAQDSLSQADVANLPVFFLGGFSSRRYQMTWETVDVRWSFALKSGYYHCIAPCFVLFFCHASCLCAWHCVFAFDYPNPKPFWSPPLSTLFGQSLTCTVVFLLYIEGLEWQKNAAGITTVWASDV